MKNRKSIVFILLLSMLLSSVSPAFALPETNGGISSGNIAGFNDINGHWAKNSIEKWSGYGVISGYQGLFRPNDSITRGEMAIILDNMMDYQVSANNKFNDLPAGQFYTDPMLKANAVGIILGDGSSLRPLDKITREEASVMLARAFAVKESSGGAVFNDTASIASWAKGYVVSMAEQEYIKGFNNNFLPKTKITRAEIVTIIDNIVKAYYTKEGTYTENVNGTAVIKVTDVTLKGVSVTGNLIIAEGVGNGEATLDSVTVKGDTVIRGGGENSIHITGTSHISNVTIEIVNGKVRVVSDGVAIQEVDIAEGDEIILDGDFGTVTNNVPGAKLTAAAGSLINKVVGNAETDVSGPGTVKEAEVKTGANGSHITTPNTKITVDSG
ncbi:MAG: S-layer homology domain-containing protein, partial [Bacillota bacterium]